MKKKFLVYVAVIVTCLFLGFTIYYIAKNDENIYLNISNDESMYINVNESIAWPVVWTKPYKDTTISVVVGDENVLDYDEQTQKFVGVNGGFTTVTIAPSNRNFGPFVFEVYVGDGKVDSPFVIRTAGELAKIGNDAQYTADMHYILVNDLDISASAWTPISEFSGSLNGKGHTIYNFNVANSTNGGLFGTILASGKVENIKFAKVAINGAYDYLGVVAGTNYGLVGKISIESGSITNTKASSYTGAIVGVNKFEANSAYVNMCSASVSITSSANAGGLVGLNKSSIILNSRAIVSFSQTATGYMGGLVGVNESSYDAIGDKYYPSAIAKSYAVVESASGNGIGAIVGQNKENNNGLSYDIYTNKYQNIIYALGEGVSINKVANGLTSVSEDKIKTSDKSDLLIAETYTGFDYSIGTIWQKEESSYANLNFFASYETVLISGIGTEINSDNVPFADFIKELIKNPSVTTTYYVTSDVEINVERDFGNVNWTTIAPNESKPLQASIVVNDGVTCKITNFKLTGANSSFFGYIAGNTIIKGITFDGGIVVDNSVEDMTAVVATKLIGGATLESIEVKNLTSFTSPANNIGLLVAKNLGTIKNSSVSYNGDLVVAATASAKNIGGIVGYNAGALYNNKTNAFVVKINNQNKTDGNFNIGGIAGITETSINTCSVENIKLETINDGEMNVGGVVGYATNGTIEIYKCYARADIDLGINNENSYLAGIIARSSSETKISACVFASGTLRGYNVAGLVGVHDGALSSSYSAGTLKGIIVSGLVSVCKNDVANCYTTSTLVGDNGSSIVNGLTAVVGGEGCFIEKCIINATFQGEGTRYAESESPFRISWLGKTFFSSRGDVDYGTVKNLVVINYGNAKVQYSMFGQKNGWFHNLIGGQNDWVEITTEDCLGKDNYSALKEKAEFSSSVWNFTNVGSYPTLWDVAI